MKLKALFLALAVAGAGASYALADDGHHDGGTTSTSTSSRSTDSGSTPTTTTQDCRRFHLRGTLVSVNGSTFTMNVLKANHAAAGAVGTALTIAITPDTHVLWAGRGVLSGPNPGDYAWVNGKQCGGDAGALTARNILFQAPGKHGGGDSTGESHPQTSSHTK